MKFKNPKEPEYQPRLGAFVYKLCGISVIGGYIFGYDTSILSPAVVYLQENEGMKPWDDVWKDAMFSASLGMAALGAIFAGIVADRYGRKKAILLTNVINILGAIICCAAFAKWVLLIGVIFLGVAIGMSSHSVPLYISESCPSYCRGRFITNFQLTICLGIVAAYAFGAAFSYIAPVIIGWRLMFLFAAVPSILQFIGFLYLPQSPRYTFEKDGVEACEKIFAQIYDNNEEWIIYEIHELRAAHERSIENKKLHGGAGVVFRVFAIPHVRKALFVGCALQIFQQASGVNTILYFTDTLFKSAGIQGDRDSIWLSVGPSMVNLMCTFIPMYLIEAKGRRLLLIASVTGCFLSLVFMAGSFLMMNKYSAVATRLNESYVDEWTKGSVPNFAACQYENCDFCVTDERCGFCSRVGEQSIEGYCYPVNDVNHNVFSSTGLCSFPLGTEDSYHHILITDGKASIDTKYEWDIDYCHTDYAVFPIIIAIIYLCCFSIGFAPLPWVMNSEFYPFWARATCMAISTFANWTIDLIVSLTYLSLSLAFTRYGLFFVYAGITFVGLIFFIFMVPETKDVSVANVELLFMSESERAKMHIDKNKEPKDFIGETWERIKNFERF